MNIFIITTIKTPELEQILNQPNTFQKIDLFLATDSGEGNMISILSSTLPSHHQVWDVDQNPGIHITSMATDLAIEGYQSQFIGPKKDHALAQKMGFQNIAEKVSELDLISQFKDIKKKLFFGNVMKKYLF